MAQIAIIIAFPLILANWAGQTPDHPQMNDKFGHKPLPLPRDGFQVSISVRNRFAAAGLCAQLGDVFVCSGLGKQILVSEIPLMGN